MQWTGLNELREKYLSFFESKGHLRLPSFPLIPRDDNSLLLINSGMAPMKKYFTGEVTPPRTRVTTCQKCIRTPDIERVGFTARHGTFFEMLGNFSFGDYFKREAIGFAWEFLTKELEIPAELLHVSVYEQDDEAYDIWTKEIGVDPSHMVRLGKEDNFWEHGSGPCGPCSEIYFDRGEKYGCGKPTCGVGCDCDRYVEVWNNVFSQFNNDGHNNYTELAQKNIDTGMGLERLACVMQGVDNLFLVDTVQNIMKHVSRVAHVAYGDDPKSDVALRVITDHIRSTTFMIGDGVMPSNEGRGYVLRRLLRRAARYGRMLGIHDLFLSDVAETVIHENAGAYPELEEKKEIIHKVIRMEEESFAKTIDQGLALLETFIQSADKQVFSGDDAFRLNDTYGFPLDLTREILAEKGMTVDEARFKELMLAQRERARAARKNAGADAWAGETIPLDGVAATKFLGYEVLSAEAHVLAIVESGIRVASADEGDEVILVLDCTPFYAESGGQVGDIGLVESAGCSVDIVGTTKDHAGIYLHRAIVNNGSLAVGDTVKAAVSEARRRSIMRNHTAAHLLQAALRRVLGTHVEQAGQLVNEQHVRFDFTHFAALTPEELAKVELLVNTEILYDEPVTMREMPIEEAKKLGAMALFGEKYGDTVRVVEAGKDFSKEFCGGTHVNSTGKLGLFKILSETSVAAGVRRIEAVTGFGVLQALENNAQLLAKTALAMKANSIPEMPERARQLTEELKEKDRQIESLNAKLASSNIKGLFESAVTVKNVKVITGMFSATTNDALRTMCDQVREAAPDTVAVFVAVQDGKATLAATVGSQAKAAGLNAGKIVKAVAQLTGGNGGGKPDFAMAGAKDLTKLDEALMAAPSIVEAML